MVANPLKTSSGNTLQNSLTIRRMEAMVVRFEVDTPFDKMEERKVCPVRHLSERRMEVMVDYFLFATRIPARKLSLSPMETQLSDFEIMPPLPEDSPQDVRSEHNLTSPLQQLPEDSP